MSFKADTYHNIGGVKFEKDINLYDFDEAGRTIQMVKINGKEISMKEFKENKGLKLGEKIGIWAPIFSKD